MSILTLVLDIQDNPHDPDHIQGRADAYDAIHDGHSLEALEARLEWMTDPRFGGTAYSTAYLSGYRAQIRDWTEYDHAERVAITHNAWETNR
ncbi:hypothetical protein ACIOEZ_34050 [Streptomyces sp. NPDC087866]|uniref:hypothetical protein n=1 Tax=Streptomyces sp. NPDC087866 TaxID=3365815 RepID=UPI00381D5060